MQQVYVKSKDGAYVAVAVRKPKGNGPFPAIVFFHGAPGGRGMEQLVGWSRGETGGPVWERFLQEGFVVVVGDYRGGDWNAMNVPSTGRLGHRRRRRPRGDRAREGPAVRGRLAHQPLRREPRRQPRAVPRLEGARPSTPRCSARRRRSGSSASRCRPAARATSRRRRPTRGRAGQHRADQDAAARPRRHRGRSPAPRHHAARRALEGRQERCRWTSTSTATTTSCSAPQGQKRPDLPEGRDPPAGRSRGAGERRRLREALRLHPPSAG